MSRSESLPRLVSLQREPAQQSESGSAVIDFILVSVPLLLMTVGVLGVALIGYSKNLATYAAIEGVRFAALADQDAAGGAEKARRVLASGLSIVPSSIDCTRSSTGWYELAISLPIPAFFAGQFNGSSELRVSAHAPAETN